MAADLELEQYITEHLAAGESEQDIREVLLLNGWAGNLINDAFAAVNRDKSKGGNTTTSKNGRANGGKKAEKPETEFYVQNNTRRRQIWATFLTIGALSVIFLASFLSLRAVIINNSYARQGLTQEDVGNKKGLDELGSDLTDYYRTHRAYPSGTHITKVDLTSSIKRYSYRVAAPTGDTCDGSHNKCSRALLSTRLSSGKTYLVILDKGVVEAASR